MKVNYTADDLIKFEEEVVQLFMDKKILAPIHLDHNNEKPLIQFFKEYVNEEDWVCSSWRSHYRQLLKGVPPDELKEKILDGKSISLCFPEYRTISSAIVGGILPIAVGLAMGMKRKGEKGKVVTFVGDMTACGGSFYECVNYANHHGLNCWWVIEDNGKSVCTDTKKTWNIACIPFEPTGYSYNGGLQQIEENIFYYKYESKYPHAGGLQRVNF